MSTGLQILGRWALAATLLATTFLFQTGAGQVLELWSRADTCCAHDLDDAPAPPCPPACQDCLACGVVALDSPQPVADVHALLAPRDLELLRPTTAVPDDADRARVFRPPRTSV